MRWSCAARFSFRWSRGIRGKAPHCTPGVALQGQALCAGTCGRIDTQKLPVILLRLETIFELPAGVPSHPPQVFRGRERSQGRLSEILSISRPKQHAGPPWPDEFGNSSKVRRQNRSTFRISLDHDQTECLVALRRNQQEGGISQQLQDFIVPLLAQPSGDTQKRPLRDTSKPAIGADSGR